jgi:hypothetical protein
MPLLAPPTSGDRRVEVAKAAAAAAGVYAAAERQIASLVAGLAERVIRGSLQPRIARRRLKQSAAIILAAAGQMAERDLGQAGRSLRADAEAAALADLAAAGLAQTAATGSAHDHTSLLPLTWTALLGRLDDASRTVLTSATAALSDILKATRAQQGDDGSQDEGSPWADVWETREPDLGPGVRSRRGEPLPGGLIAYTDTAGRNWHLGTYAKAAVFAAATKMYLGTQFATYTASAAALVVVVGPVDGACIRCEPWIGAILSLDDSYRGNVQVTGTIGDAITAGIGHPACRHSFQSYADF